MKLLSYGEDAYTLWALTTNIASLLTQLGDPGEPENTLIFYRPSFGRGSSCFGEFDAIIGTSYAVYLVEAKWSQSLQNDIPKEQEKRHKIFHWYLDKWRKSIHADWESFKRLYDAEYRKAFNKSIPSVNSALACNLEFTLKQLDSYGSLIEDVLLFIPKGDSSPLPLPSVNSIGFQVITISPKTVGGAGYIELPF